MQIRHLPPVYSRIGWLPLIQAFLGSDRALEKAVGHARQLLEALYPGKAAILTDSGTSALTIAVLTESLGTRTPTGPVAIPAYACPDVATAIIAAGRRIALYDVDPITLEPEERSLRQALEDGSTTVVAVHLYGRLLHVLEIERVAGEYGATVIEDAAQHAGAAYSGRRAGSFTALSALSFGRGKGLNAGGGGAMLLPVSSSAKLPDLLEFPRNRSRSLVAKAAATEVLSQPALYRVPASIPALGLGETRYHPPQPQFKFPSRLGPLLVSSLESEHEMLKSRHRIAERYRDLLATNTEIMLSAPEPGVREGAGRFPVRLSGPVLPHVHRLGVTRSYPRTLGEYEEISPYVVNSSRDYPGARELAKSLWTLPTHEWVTSQVQAEICRAITKK